MDLRKRFRWIIRQSLFSHFCSVILGDFDQPAGLTSIGRGTGFVCLIIVNQLINLLNIVV